MTNANEPIYPTIESSDHNIYTQSVGLTKREEFARTAMLGILSGMGMDALTYNEEAAKDAVMLADKLITALN